MSLFDDVGGDTGLGSIVDALCDRIMADPDFAIWFDGIDLDRLKGHQQAFLSVALGGPEQYGGRSIRASHSGRAITPDAFGTFVDHLRHAIASVGLDDTVANDITRRMSLMRAAVVEVH